MSNEQHRPERESEPRIPNGAPERGTREAKPVLVTPAGRFWEIALPPEMEAALRVRGF